MFSFHIEGFDEFERKRETNSKIGEKIFIHISIFVQKYSSETCRVLGRVRDGGGAPPPLADAPTRIQNWNRNVFSLYFYSLLLLHEAMYNERTEHYRRNNLRSQAVHRWNENEKEEKNKRIPNFEW